jgi:hypothetical protein
LTTTGPVFFGRTYEINAEAPLHGIGNPFGFDALGNALSSYKSSPFHAMAIFCSLLDLHLPVAPLRKAREDNLFHPGERYRPGGFPDRR